MSNRETYLVCIKLSGMLNIEAANIGPLSYSEAEEVMQQLPPAEACEYKYIIPILSIERGVEYVRDYQNNLNK